MAHPPHKKHKKERKPLIINFFQALTPVLHAPGLWRNPRDQSRDYYKPEYWVKIAQLAERGKLHGIFIGDSLSIYGGYKSQGLDGPYNFEEAAKSGNNFPKNDPTAYLAAVAISTKNVSLGFTCSTLTEHPYHFARRIATMDHISGGRIGWNVVTSALPSAGRQLLPDNKHPEKDLRYEKADEYLQVVYELLASSWRDDGVEFNRESGIFSNPDAIREINFDGKHYRVPGPQITEPTPGRLPLIIQAGASPKGRLLGAKHAELIFLAGETSQVRQQIEETRQLAREKFGRNPENLKFVTILKVIVAKTHEEAIAKQKEYDTYHDLDGALTQLGGTGLDLSPFEWDEDLTVVADEKIKNFALGFKKKHFYRDGDVITRRYVAVNFYHAKTLVGTPSEVADGMEQYVEESCVDGFNLTNILFPETFENIVDLLIPELQRRGLAQKEYAVEGGSFREQVYGVKGEAFVQPDHYAYPLKWNKGESKADFEGRLVKVKKIQKPLRIFAD